MEMKEALASDVRIYRARFRLTQSEMAEKCGISRRALQKFEAGQNTSIRTQLAVAAVVDTWLTLQQP